MGVTNFPGGIMAAGVLLPSGAAGIPAGGSHFWVRPGTGSDSNDGTSPDTAKKTVAAAFALATANKNDVIHLVAESNTGSATTDYLSAAFDWNKDLTHLVGECAPTLVSQRARIAQASTATTVTMFTVSANGCIFRNLQFFQGVDSATPKTCVAVTGDRNVFDTCHFAGIGHATMVAAGARDVLLSGAEECRFDNCTFGTDTIARNQNVTSVEFDTAAARTSFRGCLFAAHVSNAGYCPVTVTGATGFDRWNLFRECLFTNTSTNRGTGITKIFALPTDMAQGQVVLDRTYFTNPDAGTGGVWASVSGIVFNMSPAPAASGVGGEMTSV